MEKLQPELRFPEFEFSFTKNLLGDICKFSRGKGVSKADITLDGNNECIRYGELYTIYGEIIENVISKTNLDPKDSVVSQENDIIIPSSGESANDIATASCVLKDGVILGGDLNILKTSQNGVFLSYYLNNQKRADIAKLAQGQTVVHLYNKSLATLILFLPTLPEQTKIAEFLTAVDKRIELLTTKKEKLTLYKKGVMQKIFNQELRFKIDNGHGELVEPPEWVLYTGGELFESVSNKNHNSDLPILAITQEHGAIPRDLIEYSISVTDKSVSTYKVVERGDFIISLRSFQGGIEYSNYHGICSPAYIILKPKVKIVDQWFKYYFKTDSYIVQLNEKLEGIRDGKMISFRYFSETKIYLPSLEEQARISDFILSIDAQIQKVEEQITLNQTYKKGLLQKMFV